MFAGSKYVWNLNYKEKINLKKREIKWEQWCMVAILWNKIKTETPSKAPEIVCVRKNYFLHPNSEKSIS